MGAWRVCMTITFLITPNLKWILCTHACLHFPLLRGTSPSHLAANRLSYAKREDDHDSKTFSISTTRPQSTAKAQLQFSNGIRDLPVENTVDGTCYKAGEQKIKVASPSRCFPRNIYNQSPHWGSVQDYCDSSFLCPNSLNCNLSVKFVSIS